MELRHLRYFVVVAEEEHMTRAAKRLFMQQPPLSQQIKALEEELGVALFTRAAQRVQLNAAGVIFLADARDILSRVDSAVNRVRRFDLGEEGSLRIGFSSSASLHELTPPIVRAFRESHPLISLEIEEGAAPDLLSALEQERIDVAFLRSPVSHPALDYIELQREHMVVALPNNHALVNKPGPGLLITDLQDEDFIIYRQTQGTGIKDMLMNVCAQAGFQPRAVEEVYRVLAAINLVAAGLGISVVPKSLSSIQPQSVIYRPFDPPTAFTVPLNLVFRRNVDAQATRRFITLARAFAESPLEP